MATPSVVPVVVTTVMAALTTALCFLSDLLIEDAGIRQGWNWTATALAGVWLLTTFDYWRRRR